MTQKSKKLKTYVEKFFELILKGKLRLCHLAGIDPAETVLPFTNAEIVSLWAKRNICKELASFFGGEGSRDKNPKSRDFFL